MFSTILVASEAHALTLNLIDVTGNLTNTAAGKDLQIAADYWESMLTSNATVNIQVGYSGLGTNVLASTSSASKVVTVASVYQQLAATGNSDLDHIAVANLRPLDANGGLSFIDDGITTNGTTSSVSTTARVYDNDDSANNKYLDVNTSVLRALGYTGLGSSPDATITFSNTFSFDFDPTDGIQGNEIDFLGVAIHEIGHALGFTSGVDTYDYYTQTTIPSNPAASLNGSAVFSTLDLFRYSTDPKNLVPGTGPALDLSTGGSPYFSIDGGADVFNGAKFSAGQYNGDGRQASHWKDGAAGSCVEIGIMDPTFCRGTSNTAAVTDDDIAAMDALGWNVKIDALTDLNYVMTTAQIYAAMTAPPTSSPPTGSGSVPEPASWGLMVLGFGLAGAAARLRRKRALAA